MVESGDLKPFLSYTAVIVVGCSELGWAWFCQIFLPVKMEIFFTTVAKCFLIGLIVKIQLVLLQILVFINSFDLLYLDLYKEVLMAKYVHEYIFK